MPASLAGRLWYPRRAPQKTAIRFKGVFGANSDAIALRIASASALIGATRELMRANLRWPSTHRRIRRM